MTFPLEKEKLVRRDYVESSHYSSFLNDSPLDSALFMSWFGPIMTCRCAGRSEIHKAIRPIETTANKYG